MGKFTKKLKRVVSRVTAPVLKAPLQVLGIDARSEVEKQKDRRENRTLAANAAQATPGLAAGPEPLFPEQVKDTRALPAPGTPATSPELLAREKELAARAATLEEQKRELDKLASAYSYRSSRAAGTPMFEDETGTYYGEDAVTRSGSGATPAEPEKQGLGALLLGGLGLYFGGKP